MTGGAAIPTPAWRLGRLCYANASHEPSEWHRRRVPEGQTPTTRRVHLPAFVIRSAEWQALTLAERPVFLAILAHADSRRRGAVVAYSELALETGLAESTVIAAVKGLEKKGWLVVERQRIPGLPRSRTNVYAVTFPGEAGRTEAAVNRAIKEGLGARTSDLVRPEDVYQTADGRWRVRTIFLHVWELASREWQALAQTVWGLDCMLTLRAHAVAGEVELSRKRIAEIIARAVRSLASSKLRVLEAVQALCKLGVLAVRRQGGPKGHKANAYAPRVPPSCAAWEEHFIGSAPGRRRLESPPVDEPPAPTTAEADAAPAETAPSGLVYLPGVLVPFVAQAVVAPDAICPDCNRLAKLPRAHQVRQGPTEEWFADYCRGRHVEPLVAGCPSCGTALTTPEERRQRAEDKRAGRPLGPLVRVHPETGDIACSVCQGAAKNGWYTPARFAEPMRYRGGTAELVDDEPWRPPDGAALVSAWLHERGTPRAPTPAEVTLADRLIAGATDWWAAKTLVCSTWRKLDGRDVRLLNGLAARAGATNTG